MRQTRYAFFLAPLLAAGCFPKPSTDPFFIISARVVITPEVQSALDGRYPQQVLAELTLPGREPEAFRLGVLCEPSAAAVEVPAELGGISCADSAELRVWLAAFTPEPGQENCGPLSTPDFVGSGGRIAPAPGDPIAAASISQEDIPDGSCTPLNAEVTLTPAL
jgi:hypothetical protein